MLIVIKFGGRRSPSPTALQCRSIITAEYDRETTWWRSFRQGDTTDDLIEKARQINLSPSKREMDVLLSTGEQISMSLLVMALEKMGYHAVSLTGWQAGIKTNTKYSAARIKEIDTERLHSELDKKKIVIAAGFQGINKYDDITTLGRGGSDTTAVALAAALKAELCLIYTDVDGVYTADPRIVPTQKSLTEISFDEMLELASLGGERSS
jgi:aspartate kinase